MSDNLGPIQHCRSCGGPVAWAVTRAGKRLPVNPEPQAKGNLSIEQDGSKLRAALLLSDARDAARRAGQPLYTSHFATCPDANAWRAER